VKLIDFGTAKLLHEKDKESNTTGNKGTLAYMSPELMVWKPRDFSPIDHKACDMWSLGATIYQTLTYELVVQRLPRMMLVDYNKALFKFYKEINEVKVDRKKLRLNEEHKDFWILVIENLL